MHKLVKSEVEIADMRRSGRILAAVLAYLKEQTAVGLTPKQMSRLAADKLEQLGGQPAFKGFQGYPDIICISVNDQVQHSIPSNRPFKAGDVINYDFGVRYHGMVTDAGITVGVGNLSSEATRLLEGTKRALYAGIDAVRDGVHIGDVSAAIEAVLRQHKLSIVRELVGHGVGHELHEPPEVPNYGHKGDGPILRAGMTIAIEPITTLGDYQIVGDPDGWTLWTKDGSWSAQFEHTVVVTKTGAEILTEL